MMLAMVRGRNHEGTLCVARDGAHKVVGIYTTTMLAIFLALVHAFLGLADTGTAILIMLQLFFSGVVVIYLDDVLKKGYGLLPSIPLFTAGNICMSVLSKPFRLPDVTILLSTCLFCLIAVFFQGFSVALPVRATVLENSVPCTYRLKLSYVSYVAIILHRSVVTHLFCAVEFLYIIFCALVMEWNWSTETVVTYRRADGIGRYLTAPPSLADLQSDPVHVFLYIVIVLSTCAYFSLIWTRFCMVISRRFRREMLVRNADPGSDPMFRREFWRHFTKAACLGGVCIGALMVLADFAGVAGSGMGIMLAVAAMYPYLEGVRAKYVGVFGL